MKSQSLLLCFILFVFVSCNSSGNERIEKNETNTSDGPTKIENSEKKEIEKVLESDIFTTENEASNEKKPDDLQSITLQIRSEFTRIESLLSQGKLTPKIKEINCIDEPVGGNLAFFYDGNTLVKADHNFHMGDHFGQESSYYFKDGEVIFGFHRSGAWSFTGEEDKDGNAITKDEMKVQRDYFYEGKIVKQLFKDFTNYSNKKELLESEVPNKSIGEGVGFTLTGKRIIDLSKKEKLGCDLFSE